MTFDLTIAGVPKEMRSNSLRINRTMNGRSTVSFQVMSLDRTYRPALDAEVILERDSVRLFAGLITVPLEAGLAGGVKVPITSRITASDFNLYADRRAVNETIPAGTLKAALLILEPYLAIYGVSLDPSQVDGPTLPELIYKYKRLSDVLNELSTLTAQFGDQYVWEIDFDKVLRMFQPSTVAAPFDLIEDGSDHSIPFIVGDLEVERNRETYANRIIVKVPEKTELGRLEHFTGDGSTDTFALEYTLTRFPYGVIRRYVDPTMVPSGGETFGYTGEVDGGGNPVQWWYDPDTNEIIRNAGPTEAGFIYEVEFDGTFEGVGIAEDAGEIALRGLTEKVIVVEEVPADATAQSLAEGYLAQSLSIQHKIVYKTLQPGLSPGMTQTLTATTRDITGTIILTDVSIQEFGPFELLYLVKAVRADDTNVLRSFRDLYKIWRNDLSAGTGSSTSVGTPPVNAPTMGPALPFKSVQFNRTGMFGGHAHFTFEETDAVAVLIGEGHTPIGADHLLIGKNHAGGEA